MFMTKKELRAAMRLRNRALAPEERSAAAGRIFERIEALPAFQEARCVALFCSLPDEPPTGGVLRRWSRTRRVAVPRVEGETMRFFDYDPQHLSVGAFGIGEPGADAALCPPEEIDLLVIPGVAFTAAGARLGRGRGYYDRYLAQPELRARRVGVCFAHQIVGALPAEPHDAAMDVVVWG